MIRLKTLKIGVLAAVVVGGAAASALPAYAHIACNRFGECWHTSARYNTYPSGLGVIFHDDGWRDKHRRHYHWRDDPRDDHGYYEHGRWHGF